MITPAGRFKARVHRKRWGSVAYATKATLETQQELRRYWDLRKYCAGSDFLSKVIDPNDPKKGPKLSVVDESILDGLW